MDIFVDAQTGNDADTGNSRSHALSTFSEAWRRIPSDLSGQSAGRRILLGAGTYSKESGAVPYYFESKHGTAARPIVITTADARRSVLLDGSLDMYDVNYIYLIGLRINAGKSGDGQNDGEILHYANADHLLLRDMELYSPGVTREGLKSNQAQYVYVEDSDISGAWQNAIDFVAVQYGAISRNKIHNAVLAGGQKSEWCMYFKGGSAQINVNSNEIYQCGDGGFSAGQSTDMQYMVMPWVHYEAYDIKFFNNVVHDVWGAGVGVAGGYNVLIAYNTFYRIGERSHLFEATFGSRGCPNSDSPAKCTTYLASGGWGTPIDGAYQPIPNKNVFVINNIFMNPAGYKSQWQHLEITGPQTTSASSNIPNAAKSDTNLVIRGNMVWNGPASQPLGLSGTSGCLPTNVTCNQVQLISENSFNSAAPALRDPDHGDFHPVTPANWLVHSKTLPNFPGGDRVASPLAPQGDLVNAVAYDADGYARSYDGIPGALGVSEAPIFLADFE